MTIEDIEDIAHVLMSKHGLIAKGWFFNWNKRKTAFGVCDYRKKHIELSEFIFSNTETIDRNYFIDTILHEIAHALAFINDGHRGHGRPWKRWAVKVGAKPRAMGDNLSSIDKMSGVKYVVVDTSNNDKIFKTYYRKPSNRMIEWYNSDRCQLKHRPESKGMIRVKEYNNGVIVK